jgi:ATP-dependent Zn protease
MVKKVGMSEKIGLRVIPDQEGVFGQSAANMLGPGTVETMDAEVNKMLTDSYKRATSILKAHK